MTSLADSFLGRHILSFIVFLPVIGALLLFSCTGWSPARHRRAALGISLAVLALAVLAIPLFVHQSDAAGVPGGFVLTEHAEWIGGEGAGGKGIHIQYLVGVDGISLLLVLLTAFLSPLAIGGSFTDIRDREREYYALMLLLLGAMLGVFCARDLLLFYVFFEFTLIPLYFLIGIWGGPQRQKAADMFFIYTLTGSMLTFAGVLYLGWKASAATGTMTFELDALYRLAENGALSSGEQWWLFLAFFAGFAIKVPLFPTHTWLPLAHTEAPTAGSVVLAAVLLKLGTYGFLRLSLPMLPDAAVTLAPVVGVLAVAGIIYGALAAWVQSDVKKLVAYSSVSHLGFCMLGMFSLKLAGLSGAVLYMVNHGLSTGALFLVVGMMYERYHTREMGKIGGLGRKMPIFAFFVVVFTMSSIGLPGLNGFVSEFLVLLGTFTSAQPDAAGRMGPLGIAFAVPAATGILLGAIYMLHMVRQVLFGPLKEPGGGADTSRGLSADLTRREVAILAPIAAVCLFLGVYPKPALDLMNPALERGILAKAHSSMPVEPAAFRGDAIAASSKGAATAPAPEPSLSLVAGGNGAGAATNQKIALPATNQRIVLPVSLNVAARGGARSREVVP